MIGESERERPSIPWLQWLGLGQAKAKSLELQLGLTSRYQSCSLWAILYCLLGAGFQAERRRLQCLQQNPCWVRQQPRTLQEPAPVSFMTGTRQNIENHKNWPMPLGMTQAGQRKISTWRFLPQAHPS